MSSTLGPITAILERIRGGSPEAMNELVTLVYRRFRDRARRRLRLERPGHSLATTDLTNETLLRLLKGDELARAADRNQLFRAFARAMRQVLIDHARRRKADRRGGGRKREELDDVVDDICSRIDVLALDEALQALAAVDARAAAVVEMRFFGGCQTAEIAAELGVSASTVERNGRFGLAWLRNFLSPEGTS